MSGKRIDAGDAQQKMEQYQRLMSEGCQEETRSKVPGELLSERCSGEFSALEDNPDLRISADDMTRVCSDPANTEQCVQEILADKRRQVQSIVARRSIGDTCGETFPGDSAAGRICEELGVGYIQEVEADHGYDAAKSYERSLAEMLSPIAKSGLDEEKVEAMKGAAVKRAKTLLELKKRQAKRAKLGGKAARAATVRETMAENGAHFATKMPIAGSEPEPKPAVKSEVPVEAGMGDVVEKKEPASAGSVRSKPSVFSAPARSAVEVERENVAARAEFRRVAFAQLDKYFDEESPNPAITALKALLPEIAWPHIRKWIEVKFETTIKTMTKRELGGYTPSTILAYAICKIADMNHEELQQNIARYSEFSSSIYGMISDRIRYSGTGPFVEVRKQGGTDIVPFDALSESLNEDEQKYLAILFTVQTYRANVRDDAIASKTAAKVKEWLGSRENFTGLEPNEDIDAALVINQDVSDRSRDEVVRQFPFIGDNLRELNWQ